MKKVFANKKLLLLSFLIPFVLATVAYHSVYVCDASVRGQWMDLSKVDLNDKESVDKALEQEEHRRFYDVSAWGIHALVVGIPVGLLSLLASTGIYLLIVTRRGKAGDVV